MHGRRLHSHRARCTFVRVVTVRLAAGVALQQAKIWASVDGPLAEEAVPLEAVPAEQLPDHVKLRHSAVVLSTVCNSWKKRKTISILREIFENQQQETTTLKVGASTGYPSHRRTWHVICDP